MSVVPIVTVNASVVQAPVPNNLLQTGALISQGGTTSAAQSLTPLPLLASLTPILSAAKALSSLVWAGSVVTATTTSPHGWTGSETIPIIISGAVPAGYNGTFNGTITGVNTFTYPLVSNPGSNSTPGFVTLGNEAELLSMATTYFAGNGVQQVNVLELGEGNANDGVAALTTFLANTLNTPNQQFSFLVPREWDGNAAFLALLKNYSSPSSINQFFVTTTVANRAFYAGLSNVCAIVEAPGIPATEFSAASPFGSALKANPSSSNKVPPLSYAPSYGTTAYPLTGNQATLAQLAAANVGWIGTGQQGGITGNIVFQGQMADGNPWNFWYSVFWAQIFMNQALANEVINGSATSLNPLYYNQDGINRLQNRAVNVGNQAVSYGLALGQVVAVKLPIAQFLANVNAGAYVGNVAINAEPFFPYTTENPNDYGAGKYAGLSCIYTPLRGFLNVFFNLTATTLLI